MGVRRVVPLTLGWVDVPRSCSVHGADPGVRLRQPVPAVLVQVEAEPTHAPLADHATECHGLFAELAFELGP